MKDCSEYPAVLIFCALKEEADSFIQVSENIFQVSFIDRTLEANDYSFKCAVVENDIDEQFYVYVAWPADMGPDGTSVYMSVFLAELKPQYTFMSGICAGDKKKTYLGDIIVASRAFKYDQGKSTVDSQGRFVLSPDVNSKHPTQLFLQFARGFDDWKKNVNKIPRPVSHAQQKSWIVSELLKKQDAKISDIVASKLRKNAPDHVSIFQIDQKLGLGVFTKQKKLRSKYKKQLLESGDLNHFIADPAVPTVHIEPMASGDLVRADSPFEKITRPVRKCLAVDMESASFYYAATSFKGLNCLLVKSVCDYADAEKDDSYHEYSTLASASYIVEFFKKFCTYKVLGWKAKKKQSMELLNKGCPPAPDRFVGVRELIELTKERHIRSPYKNVDIMDSAFFEVNSSLFYYLAETTIQHSKQSFIADVYRYIVESKELHPLAITGPSGSGKSSLLTCIYHYSCEQYLKRGGGYVPYYISIETYNPELSADNNEKKRQVLSEIDSDIKLLRNFVHNNNNTSLLIIIDGLGESNKFEGVISERLFNLFETIPHKKIIGLDPCFGLIKGEGQQHCIRTQRGLNLSFMHRLDDNFHEFVKTYLASVGSNSEANYKSVISIVDKSKIQRIDLFLLHLIQNYHPINVKDSRLDIVDFYDAYLRQKILGGVHKDKVDLIIRKSSEVAFNLVIKKHDLGYDDFPDDLVWRCVQRHRNFTHYLSALYVVGSLVEYDKKLDTSVFSHVYPYSINKYCKIILNKYNSDTDNRFYKVLPALLNSKDVTFKADVCYLAGRINDSQIRYKVVDLLKKEKFKQLDKTDKLKRRFESSALSSSDVKQEFKRNLLYLRTLYISLSVLEDKQSENEYIKMLMENNYYDVCNRGFHLEYYGDLEYNPELPLLHADTLEDFPNTFSELKFRLTKQKANHLYQIEVYTLASLVNHRLVVGEMSQAMIDKTLQVLEVCQSKNRIRDRRLRLYLNETINNLRQDNYSLWLDITNLLRLQEIPRTGWVDRGVVNPESVADHTMSAYHLAFMLLPIRIANRDYYSRQRILSMLAIHDWAEVFVGDTVSPKKTKKDKKDEENAITKMSFLGSYVQTQSMSEISKLYSEYDSGHTYNSKLARDFDKFQTLIRLYQYRRASHKFQDGEFEYFRGDLQDSIKTTFVANLANSFLNYYDSNEHSWDQNEAIPFDVFCGK